MEKSFTAYWAVWSYKQNAEIDECLLLSMNIDPKHDDFIHTRPFERATVEAELRSAWQVSDTEVERKPQRIDMAATYTYRQRTVTTQQLNEELDSRQQRCKWAQAFPDPQEREAAYTEMWLRLERLAANREEIDHLRNNAFRFPGLRKSDLTMAYFRRILDFTLPPEAGLMADRAAKVLPSYSNVEQPKTETPAVIPSKNSDELNPKEKRSLLKIIAGLVCVAYSKETALAELSKSRIDRELFHRDITTQGIDIDIAVLSRYLKEAAEELPKG